MADRKRILVVDDEEFVRRLVGQILDRGGYDVDFAVDGDGALAQMELRRPDLVILDLMMPGKDGWAVLEHMRRRPDMPPVILLTGHGSYEAFTRAVRAGVSGYLSKPFSLDGLLLTVSRALATGRSPAHDRRGEPRRPLVVRVRVTGPDSAALAVGELVNVNAQGGQVDLAVPLTAGARVRLTFDIHGVGTPMVLDASVEWQQAIEGRYLHGLVFRDLSPDSRRALEHLLEAGGPPA
jgi:CheY-like chemotaxis protein